MQDIKKMFAKEEHVRVESTIFGTYYYDKKSGKKISKPKALRLLAGYY